MSTYHIATPDQDGTFKDDTPHEFADLSTAMEHAQQILTDMACKDNLPVSFEEISVQVQDAHRRPLKKIKLQMGIEGK